MNTTATTSARSLVCAVSSRTAKGMLWLLTVKVEQEVLLVLFHVMVSPIALTYFGIRYSQTGRAYLVDSCSYQRFIEILSACLHWANQNKNTQGRHLLWPSSSSVAIARWQCTGPHDSVYNSVGRYRWPSYTANFVLCRYWAYNRDNSWVQVRMRQMTTVEQTQTSHSIILFVAVRYLNADIRSCMVKITLCICPGRFLWM